MELIWDKSTKKSTISQINFTLLSKMLEYECVALVVTMCYLNNRSIAHLYKHLN